MIVLDSQTSIVRSLSRGIWINVGAPTSEKSRLDAQGNVIPLSDKEKGEREKDLEDKKKCLRLLVAFVVATKHHLRGEYGTDWPGK
jgi:putative membrane protein